MLFQIDASLTATLLSDRTDKATVGAIERLCFACFDGKHRITASSQDELVQLSECELLSNQSRAVFRDASSDFQNDQSLVKHLEVWAIVHAKNQQAIVCKSIGGQRIIELHTSWLDDSEKLYPTTLVGENLIDCDLLERIVLVIKSVEETLNVPVAYLRQNGGGDTTDQVIEDVHGKGRLVCAIVDSDRSAPGAPLGPTAQKVQRFKDPTIYPLTGVTETVGHELENSVSSRFYSLTYSKDINQRDLLKCLDGAAAANEIDLPVFLDIKEGITLGDILRLSPESPAGSFWRRCLPILSGILHKNFTASVCWINGECLDETYKNCSCTILNGNRSRILKLFCDYIDAHGALSIAADLNSATRAEWIRITRFLVSWGCARERVRM